MLHMGAHRGSLVFSILCFFSSISADGATGLVDGDILQPKESDNDIEKRNAIRDRSYLWRNRVVPYSFDSSLGKLSILLFFCDFIKT